MEREALRLRTDTVPLRVCVCVCVCVCEREKKVDTCMLDANQEMSCTYLAWKSYPAVGNEQQIMSDISQ